MTTGTRRPRWGKSEKKREHHNGRSLAQTTQDGEPYEIHRESAKLAEALVDERLSLTME